MRPAYVVGLGLAFVLGSCYGGSDEPPPEFIEVPRTKVVEVPAEPLDPIVLVPESCLLAASYADRISRHADKMYASGDEQLAIISDARKALAEGGDLNAIENRQRRLQGHTVGNLYEVSVILTRFQSAYKECKKEQE